MLNQDLLSRIDQRLRATGLTDYRASMMAAGRPEVIRNIRRGRSNNPRRDTLEKLARVLECSFEWLATGRGPIDPVPETAPAFGAGGLQTAPDTPHATTPDAAQITAPAAIHHAAMPVRTEMPQDIPVMGTAAGSMQGAFQLDTGAPVDHVRRPPGIASAIGVYAIYVTGESMTPRFEDGELIYVSPARPPRIGDYVVVQIQNGGDGPEAFCKRLVRRTTDMIVLEQFHPAAELEFPMHDVVAMHRIMSMNDLFGV